MSISIQLLEEGLKQALKNKEELTATTLRMLLSALHNAAKDKKYRTGEEGLSPEEIESIVASEAKKRRESIEAFLKGGRQDLVAKEKAELDILLPFLPPQLLEEDVEKLVREAIASTGATTQKDLGKVMGALAPKVKGRADGSLVSQKVKSLLSSS
ncbi:MAG: GatB/YqeY domain-containing protein [Parcubacteria group bacterium]|nr:GatB/YqeY domain-containing protein [Parcubacteria group bacterium]